jgi:type I restriction enzyme, S subunit
MGGEWRDVQLGDVANLTTGYPFKSHNYTDDIDAPRIIGGDNIAQGYIRWDKIRRWPSNMTNGLEDYWLEPGDVVLAMDRPWIEAGLKRASIGPQDVPSLLIQRTSRLRGTALLDTAFLRYLIGSQAFTQYILGVQTGTAVPHISPAQIRAFAFLLPPLPEQRAIAHILGTLDDKIELNRRRNETLEAMARALFKDWFVDFGPVRAKMEGRDPYLPAHLWELFPDRLDDEGKPEGWEMRPLGDFIDIFDSRRVPLSGKRRAERQGPYPYHGAAGVMDSVDDFLFDGVHVLIGEDGSVVRADGRPYTQYVWGKFWVNNHAHVLRGRGITSETLLIFLDQCDVAPFVTGAVQPKLSQRNLKAILFIDAGNALFKCFGEVVGPLFAHIRDATEESRTLAQLRESLLPKLISGELRITNVEKFL